MTEPRQDGIYYDLPESLYHSDTGSLSSTGARKLLPPSTPAHFQRWRQTIQPPNDNFDLGKVVHVLVLGSGGEYVEVPHLDWRSSAAKEMRDDARRSGLVPLLSAQLNEARKMADAVLTHPEAGPLFTRDGGHSEVSVFATDPRTGVRLRARFDRLNGCDAVDLKTAASAEPSAFERSAAKFAYHVQEAFYRHVAKCAGLEIGRFEFVAVEKGTNFVTVHEWDDFARKEADARVREAIDLYAHHTARETWPDYPAGPHLMSLPAYLLDDEMVITK